MTGKELFEHYVNLTITDASISNCDRTDFSTYGGYAEYIHGQLKQENFSTINRYIFSIATELQIIYGFETNEAVAYVVKFFYDKIWERYHKAVKMVRSHFGIFLSP